jgi:hypothetical protein
MGGAEMKRVLALVEGGTEYTFVQELLLPHLRTFNIEIVPKILVTLRDRAGKAYRGGVATFGQVERDVRLLLQDSNAALVITMIDFYGLAGKGFPGWETLPGGSCYDKVRHVETVWAEAVNNRRFVPYLSLHEFEAFILAQPANLGAAYPSLSDRVVAQLEAAAKAVASPEEINLDEPPSKRLEQLIPEYDKDTGGNLAVLEIGLPTLRAVCPHFDAWVKRIEALGDLET